MGQALFCRAGLPLLNFNYFFFAAFFTAFFGAAFFAAFFFVAIVVILPMFTIMKRNAQSCTINVEKCFGAYPASPRAGGWYNQSL